MKNLTSEQKILLLTDVISKLKDDTWTSKNFCYLFSWSVDDVFVKGDEFSDLGGYDVLFLIPELNTAAKRLYPDNKKIRDDMFWFDRYSSVERIKCAEYAIDIIKLVDSIEPFRCVPRFTR